MTKVNYDFDQFSVEENLKLENIYRNKELFLEGLKFKKYVLNYKIAIKEPIFILCEEQDNENYFRLQDEIKEDKKNLDNDIFDYKKAIEYGAKEYFN